MAFMVSYTLLSSTVAWDLGPPACEQYGVLGTSALMQSRLGKKLPNQFQYRNKISPIMPTLPQHT